MRKRGSAVWNPPFLESIIKNIATADDYPLVYIVSQWVQEKTSPEIKDCQWFYIHALPCMIWIRGAVPCIEKYCFGSNVSLYWNPKRMRDIKIEVLDQAKSFVKAGDGGSGCGVSAERSILNLRP